MNFLDQNILLPIYNDYLEAFERCGKIDDSCSNLMGVVFHEIMYFTSCTVYDKYWYSNDSNIEYPFLGYRAHKYSSINKQYPVSNKRKAISLFSKYVSRSGYKVAILNPSVDVNKLVKLLLKNKIQVVFPSTTQITIPFFEEQVFIVEHTLKNIWNKYELGNNFYDFIHAIKISYKELNKRNNNYKYDLLLTGSPVKIPVRIEAVNALMKNIPTICIDHGNETGTEDNPAWGYDEQSYCSHFIGYGPAGFKAIENGKYLQSLFNNNPKYIESNSTFIKNIYNHDEIEVLRKDISKLKLAYIPIRLMGAQRLGPYLSISDEDYLEWQKYIFKHIKNLDYKAHPKQKINYEFDKITIVRDSLESCVNRYDCFVTDNVMSTAFTNIAATNKAIIYFNIGFGNLTKCAEEVIRRRVIWIDIDIGNPGSLLEKIEKKKDKKLINNYTKQFSITSHSDDREETIIKTIKSIMAT